MSCWTRCITSKWVKGLPTKKAPSGTSPARGKGATRNDQRLHGRTMHEGPSGQGVAVQRPRHLDVGEEQRNIVSLREDRQSLVRTFGLEDLEALVGEEIENHHPHERLILDDEDDRFVGRQD